MIIRKTSYKIIRIGGFLSPGDGIIHRNLFIECRGLF